MKLLLCPECNQWVPAVEILCPNCGCPSSEFVDMSRSVQITLPPLGKNSTILSDCLVTRVQDKQVLARIPWGGSSILAMDDATYITLRPEARKFPTAALILLIVAHISLIIPLLWPLAIYVAVQCTKTLVRQSCRPVARITVNPGETYTFNWQDGELRTGLSESSGGSDIGSGILDSIMDAFFH